MDAVQTETSVEIPAVEMVDPVGEEDAEAVAPEPSDTPEEALPVEAMADSLGEEDAGVVAPDEADHLGEALPVKAMADSAEEEDAGVVTPDEADRSEEALPVEAMADSMEEDAGLLDLEESDASEMGELPVEDWDYQRPRRGEVRPGIILSKGEQEIIVDVGAKRDGVVPFADMQRMGAEAIAALRVGDEVPVYVMRPEDQDGNLLVSLFLARQAQAWVRAQELADSGEAWEEQVVGFNKGGLVVPVGEIRGFVPASQVPGFPLGLNQEERLTRLSSYVGETLQVKVIEINRRKRRLILSATAAQRQWRQMQRERLLEELREGEVRKGHVSSLASFGAFVDLGGADGLVHLSELSWRRIRHPREVVKVGQEVEVYVLRLDEEKNRIGLSLKRLQPEPWALVEDKYELGQLVEGVVTNAVDFGAFAEIDEGVEGLIHVSELSDAPVSHPRDVVKKGDLLLLRIIRIDVRRKRLGLSLKRVLESEWSEWAASVALQEAEKRAAAGEAEPASAEAAEEPAEFEPSSAEEAEPVAAAEVLDEAEEAEEEAEPVAAAEVLDEAEEEAEPVAAAEVLDEAEEAEEEAEPVAAAEVLDEAEEAEEEAEPVAAVMAAGAEVEETGTSSDLPEDETQTSEGTETFGGAESSTEEDLELAAVEA